MSKISEDRDFELIVLAALRFALSSSSYIPDIVAEYIINNWQDFSAVAQRLIHLDIKTYCAQSMEEKQPWIKVMALKVDDKKERTP